MSLKMWYTSDLTNIPVDICHCSDDCGLPEFSRRLGIPRRPERTVPDSLLHGSNPCIRPANRANTGVIALF